MKNTLKMFVLALTMVAFGGISFAADQAMEKAKAETAKAEKAKTTSAKGEVKSVDRPRRESSPSR